MSRRVACDSAGRRAPPARRSSPYKGYRQSRPLSRRRESIALCDALPPVQALVDPIALVLELAHLGWGEHAAVPIAQIVRGALYLVELVGRPIRLTRREISVARTALDPLLQEADTFERVVGRAAPKGLTIPSARAAPS